MPTQSSVNPGLPRQIDRDETLSGMAGDFCAHWLQMYDSAGGIPHRKNLQPWDLKPMLPRLLILEVMPDWDFKYRLMGTHIDKLSRGRYTGRRAREVPGHGPGGGIYALYRTTTEAKWLTAIELPYVGPSELCHSVTQIAAPMMARAGRLHLLSLVDFHLINDAEIGDFLEEHASNQKQE